MSRSQWASLANSCVHVPALSYRDKDAEGPALMTNRIAIVLGLLLICAVVVDVMFYGTEHIVFLGKKLIDLIEWVAFWR